MNSRNQIAPNLWLLNQGGDIIPNESARGPRLLGSANSEVSDSSGTSVCEPSILLKQGVVKSGIPKSQKKTKPSQHGESARDPRLQEAVNNFYGKEAESESTGSTYSLDCTRRFGRRNAASLDEVRVASVPLNDELQTYLEASSNNSGVPPPSPTGRVSISMDGRPSENSSASFIVRKEHIDIRSLYKFERELGRGASGVVHRCTDFRTGLPYACKSISKGRLQCPLDVKDLQSEVGTLRIMQQSPAVIGLKGVYEDEKSVHLVMEYCEGGDLFDRIKERRYFTEPEAAKIVQTIASVLSFSHSNGIMHRDLKPENILLSSKYVDTDIRVADFGSSAFFRPGQKLNQLVGSPFYISPGVLQHNYGPGADLWSLGVILYILLSGKPPFFGSTTAETLKKVQFGELDLESGRFVHVSKGAKKLIERLLNRNEEQRITARQVLKHPWVKSYCQEIDASNENVGVDLDFTHEDRETSVKDLYPRREKHVKFGVDEAVGLRKEEPANNGIGRFKRFFERKPTPFWQPLSASDAEDEEEEEVEVSKLEREETIVYNPSSPRRQKMSDYAQGSASKFFGAGRSLSGKNTLKDSKWKSKSALNLALDSS